MDSNVKIAPSATNTGFKSDIGLAVQMFPPMDATFLTCFPAKYLQFSKSAWNPFVSSGYH
jgi:hypothetical protein